MVCPKCKYQSPDGATVCNYCGNQLTNTNKKSGNDQFKYLWVGIISIIAFVYSFYLGYNLFKEERDTVKVAYAKRDINRYEELTEDIIGYKEVPKSANNAFYFLTDNDFKYYEGACATEKIVEGAYINYDDLIYCDDYIEEGYKILELKLGEDNILNSYALNKYVNIYVRMKDPNSDGIYFGQVLDYVQVLDVLDNSAKSISSYKDSASSVVIIVDDETYDIFSKAMKVDDLKFSIAVVKNDYSALSSGVNEEFKSLIEAMDVRGDEDE